MENSKKKTLLKAALYCRVSTLEQIKGEFSSLDSQKEQLKTYCKSKNWDIYKIYIDKGKTAANLDRPAFQQIIRDAESGKFEVLVATKLDRISRNSYDWYPLIQKFDSYGVKISACDYEMNTDNAVGKMQRSMIITFTQFEREMTAERTAEKKYESVKKGIWNGGIPPTGYLRIESKLKINEDYRKPITKIFTDYSKGINPASIASELNNNGIKTPLYKTKTGKILGDKKFNSNIITRILKNSVYAGKIPFLDQNYDGLHEGFITFKLWEKCQQRFKPKRNYRAGTSKLLLLSGIIKCGYCGAAMTTHFTTKANGKRHVYYQCTTVQKYKRESCAQKNLNAPEIERLVIKICTELARDPSYVQSCVSKMQKLKNTEMDELSKQQIKFKKKISELTKQQQNLISFIKNHNPKDTSKLIKEELNQLDVDKYNLESKASNLEQLTNVLKNEIIDTNQISKFFNNFNDIFPEIEDDAKRRIINVLIENISVKIHHKSKKGKIDIKPRNLKNILLDEKSLESSSLGKHLLRRRDSNPRPGG